MRIRILALQKCGFGSRDFKNANSMQIWIGRKHKLREERGKRVGSPHEIRHFLPQILGQLLLHSLCSNTA